MGLIHEPIYHAHVMCVRGYTDDSFTYTVIGQRIARQCRGLHLEHSKFIEEYQQHLIQIIVYALICRYE
jgi:hypothetical protein